MLKEILKEEEEEFENRWVVRAQNIEAFITVVNEEELDSFKADMHKSYAKIIKAVCEEMEEAKREKDGSLTMVVDTFMCGFNYRGQKLREKAKQLIEETKL